MRNTKLLFITESEKVPYVTGNGVSVLMMGIVRCLSMTGWDVSIALSNYSDATLKSADNEIRYLGDSGFSVIKLEDLQMRKTPPSRWRIFRRIIWPRLSDHFLCPADRLRRLQSFIDEKEIRFVYGFGWRSTAILAQLRNVTTIVSLVDLVDDLANLERIDTQFLSRRSLLRRKVLSFQNRRVVSQSYQFLRDVDVIVEHASQHAVKLRSLGYGPVYYIPHPLPKPERNFIKTANVSQSDFSVLIPGSLKGASSQLGFKYFFEELLPNLKERGAATCARICFRVVGHGKPSEYLIKKCAEHNDVELVGFVEDIAIEYEKADVILVTIPVPHGFRTRIVEAFSYGLCVVAHSANKDGMPELENDKNAVVENDPAVMADKLISLIGDPSRRTWLSRNALATFEGQLSQDAAVRKYSDIFAGQSGQFRHGA